MQNNVLSTLKKERNFALKNARKARKVMLMLQDQPPSDAQHTMLTSAQAAYAEARKAVNRSTYSLQKARPRPLKPVVTGEELMVLSYMRAHVDYFNKVVPIAEDWAREQSYDEEQEAPTNQ